MNDEALLDPVRLTEIKTLLGDNFAMLLEVFLKDSPDQASNICSWTDPTQNQGVMMAAHTLKSSAASLGLNKLATQCNIIETACREDGEIDIPSLTSGMQILFDDSINSLREAALS